MTEKNVDNSSGMSCSKTRDCDMWTKSMWQLDEAVEFYVIDMDRDYQGEGFKFCPWCGFDRNKKGNIKTGELYMDEEKLRSHGAKLSESTGTAGSISLEYLKIHRIACAIVSHTIEETGGNRESSESNEHCIGYAISKIRELK